MRAVGPRLRVLLACIFGLVAILGANSAYLLSITVLEAATKLAYQNYFYQYMFLAHLVLGLLLVVPFVVFGLLGFGHSDVPLLLKGRCNWLRHCWVRYSFCVRL